MEWVQIAVEQRIAKVVMSRIDKRNALNPQMVSELLAAYQELNQREDVKVIVLMSAASAFSAGADLAYLQSLRDFTFDENVADSRKLKTLFETIYHSPKITCSLVDGPALAGGCGLASIVDFCFASTEATFGYTESKIGFVPALVMVYLRHKMGVTKRNEWLITGSVFSAQKAYEDGLIYKVSPKEEVENELHQFCTSLVEGVSAQSVTRIKDMLRNLPENHEEALEFAAQQNAHARKSTDCMQGIDRFLRKEKSTW